jgi:hypothetical protein
MYSVIANRDITSPHTDMMYVGSKAAVTASIMVNQNTAVFIMFWTTPKYPTMLMSAADGIPYRNHVNTNLRQGPDQTGVQKDKSASAWSLQSFGLASIKTAFRKFLAKSSMHKMYVGLMKRTFFKKSWAKSSSVHKMYVD